MPLPPIPFTSRGLHDAVRDFQVRAMTAMNNVRRNSPPAAKLAGLAAAIVGQLESALALKEARRHPTAGSDPGLVDRLSAAWDATEAPLRQAIMLHAAAQPQADGADLVLTPLRDEGCALLAITQAFAGGFQSAIDSLDALHGKIAALNDEAQTTWGALERLFGSDLARRERELKATGESVAEQTWLAFEASQALNWLPDLVDRLVKEDHEVQLRRGNWTMIGIDLGEVAEFMAKDPGNRAAWLDDPLCIIAKTQLHLMQKVAIACAA